MRIAATYSLNGGKKVVTRKYPDLLVEVNAAIKAVDASEHKTKVSTEKTMPGRMLFSPKSLNKAFKQAFAAHGDWKTVRVKCDYSSDYIQTITTYVRRVEVLFARWILLSGSSALKCNSANMPSWFTMSVRR